MSLSGSGNHSPGHLRLAAMPGPGAVRGCVRGTAGTGRLRRRRSSGGWGGRRARLLRRQGPAKVRSAGVGAAGRCLPPGGGAIFGVESERPSGRVAWGGAALRSLRWGSEYCFICTLCFMCYFFFFFFFKTCMISSPRNWHRLI